MNIDILVPTNERKNNNNNEKKEKKKKNFEIKSDL